MSFKYLEGLVSGLYASQLMSARKYKSLYSLHDFQTFFTCRPHAETLSQKATDWKKECYEISQVHLHTFHTQFHPNVYPLQCQHP